MKAEPKEYYIILFGDTDEIAPGKIRIIAHPTVYNSLTEAKKSAEQRLQGALPGASFTVFKAVAQLTVPTSPVIEKEL